MSGKGEDVWERALRVLPLPYLLLFTLSHSCWPGRRRVSLECEEGSQVRPLVGK